jgi:hypothetical protein
MKVASMDNWPVLQKFYRKLAQDMHAGGINSLTTGGFACVWYAIAQQTKDCDIIIPVEKAAEVLQMLAQTNLEGHQCHLTLK